MISGIQTILVLSDIQYACSLEKARRGHERRAIKNPLLRLFVTGFRHFIWLRDPFGHNHLLDQVLNQPSAVDYVIANGDYSCDTGFVGVSDEAACRSAQECLGKLRERFGEKFYATIGDHELGKMSLFGGSGGMRLASWHRTRETLKLEPFWELRLGHYRVIGVVSSLLALPVYEPETLPEERRDWQQLRVAHFDQIRLAFAALQPHERVLLFCHDPTALPFLWQDELIRSRLPQVEQTFIGHLHSELVFWKSRLLAGMPTIRFLGNSIRRMSTALNEGRHWRPFKVRLCPSLSGSELLKDGGYYLLEVDPAAKQPPRFRFQRLKRR
jgi:hypothetical protein